MKIDAQTPTVRTYRALIYAYQFFNQALFENTLPEVVITYHRQNRIMGYASFKRWADDDGNFVDELAINPEYFAKFPMLEICQTLVHEMVHIWQTHFGSPSRRNYHNTEWAQKMEVIGLMPSHTGKPGGKRVGDMMMDYAIIDGPFFVACRRLIEQGFFIPLKDRFPIFRQNTPILVFDAEGDAYEVDKHCKLRKKLASGSDIQKTVNEQALDALSSSVNAIDLQTKQTEIDTEFEAPSTSKPRPKAGRVKYTCPDCRINVWGKPGLNVGCLDCNVKLIETN